jgi:hypothetical protein
MNTTRNEVRKKTGVVKGNEVVVDEVKEVGGCFI